MKKLLLILGLLISNALFGAETAVTITGGPLVYTTLITNRATIALISVTATTANAVTASFYDNNVTNVTYVTSAYNTRTSVAGTNTTVYTNTIGGLATNIMIGIKTTVTTTAAATNTFPFDPVLVAPASGQITRVVDLTSVRGLSVRTTTNCVIDVVYHPTP